jgi:hypothetical protein
MNAKPCPKLIGLPIRVFGRIWIIEGINYLDDYDIVRFDSTRRTWQRSSASGKPLPPEHPHFWESVGPEYQNRMRKAVRGWRRLDYWLNEHDPCARRRRRAESYKSILRRFFKRVQEPRPKGKHQP